MKTSLRFVSLALGLALGGAFISGCAGTSTRESTGEYIDNSALTAKVKKALVSDEIVKARDVQVETFRGTVQLSGFVDSNMQKDRAAEVARSIPGVRDVKNNLIVKTASSALRALTWVRRLGAACSGSASAEPVSRTLGGGRHAWEGTRGGGAPQRA